MWWPRHMRDLAPVVGLFLRAQYEDFYAGLSESLPSAPSPDELSDPGSGGSDPHRG